MRSKYLSDALSRVRATGKARFEQIARAFDAESIARPVARFLHDRPRLRSTFDRFTKAVHAGIERPETSEKPTPRARGNSASAKDGNSVLEAR